jgi:YfiH family protein
MTDRVGVVREEQITTGGVCRYELTDWSREFGVVAGVTGAAESFDLGLASHDSTATVLARWSALQGCLGDGFRSFVVGRQVHGTSLEAYGDLPHGLLITEGLDGHLTSQSGVVLSVSVADCIPVYLVEPQSGCLGLLHAGWRGVADGILEKGAARLADLAGVPVPDIVIHCGVGICGACYEVGSEVFEAVLGVTVPGPALLDLRRAVASRAQGLGIDRVSVSGHCTSHDADRFYSHRASGGAAGRMIAYVGRPMG